ncbi:MAG: hybrid sensor histidine kinase/response regulator [Planctomycetota bacterium]|nr:hybrid sensor histidine kinase/response regulator [Planctomycetota bacterium]
MSNTSNLADDPELVAEFTMEAMAGLTQVDQSLLALEQGPDDEAVNEVFRAVHSVKGSAGFLGFESVQNLAHEFETILDRVRHHTLKLNSEGIDVMLKVNDSLKSLVEAPASHLDLESLIKSLKDWEAKQNHPIPEDSPAVVAQASDVEMRIEESSNQIDASIVQLADGLEINDNVNLEKKSVPEVIEAIRNAFSVETAAAPVSVPATLEVAKQSVKVADAKPLPAAVNKAVPEITAPAKSSLAVPALNAATTTSTSASPTASPVANPKASAHDSTIRVPVTVLEELVTLAGELVLSRNQLLRMIDSSKLRSFTAIGSRIDQVTTSMQDAIMSARMQQVSILFNRFPRLVRDLNQKLDKRCRLLIEGGDVELDKTIIEALGDPLTHLLRNSLDHGIESPEKRVKARKPAEGTLQLKAFHEGGKVRIIIEDDGAGVNRERVVQKAIERGLVPADAAHRMSDREIVNLIFKPGFSTAEVVSDVSGRGVGMDVVRTNIERIGGTVDVESDAGRGSRVHITLPLTLAIIPSWIVQQDDFQFAIPEAAVIEFISLTPSDISKRLETVNDSEMIRWRNGLLPLIRLRECLPTSCRVIDRRQRINKIVVIETGIFQFGLAVDQVCDPEHVVVKPIGNHLGQCGYLEGVAVLGDGNVAFILGMQGIAERARLGVKVESVPDESVKIDVKRNESQAAVILRRRNGNLAAIPRMVLQRIERIDPTLIQKSTNKLIMPYRGEQLQVFELDPGLLRRVRIQRLDHCYVAVFTIREVEFGLLVPEIIDIRDISTAVSMNESVRRAVCGTVLVDDVLVELLDLYAFADEKLREPVVIQEQKEIPIAPSGRHSIESQSIEVGKVNVDWSQFTILLAEDTPFFRNQVQKFLEQSGFNVRISDDGQQAWQFLSDESNKVDLLLTDIEMPIIDGFELALKVRSSPRLQDLPIVAITSLHTEAAQRRGKDVGIDEWQIKLDRDKLTNAIQRQLLSGKRISVNYFSEAT